MFHLEKSLSWMHTLGGGKRPDLSTSAPAIEMIAIFLFFYVYIFTIVDLSSGKSKRRQTSKLKRGMSSLITVNRLWIHD